MIFSDKPGGVDAATAKKLHILSTDADYTKNLGGVLLAATGSWHQTPHRLHPLQPPCPVESRLTGRSANGAQATYVAKCRNPKEGGTILAVVTFANGTVRVRVKRAAESFCAEGRSLTGMAEALREMAAHFSRQLQQVLQLLSTGLLLMKQQA